MNIHFKGEYFKFFDQFTLYIISLPKVRSSNSKLGQRNSKFSKISSFTLIGTWEEVLKIEILHIQIRRHMVDYLG